MRLKTRRALAPSGVLYRDTLVRVVVDVPDSGETRRWMKEFRIVGGFDFNK